MQLNITTDYALRLVYYLASVRRPAGSAEISNSTLHVTNSTIRNGASDGIYVGDGSNGTVTGTTVEVQQGYGIRAVGSDTDNAAITLDMGADRTGHIREVKAEKNTVRSSCFSLL